MTDCDVAGTVFVTAAFYCVSRDVTDSDVAGTVFVTAAFYCVSRDVTDCDVAGTVFVTAAFYCVSRESRLAGLQLLFSYGRKDSDFNRR